MDPESDSQGAIIVDERNVKVTKIRINQAPYLALAIIFIVVFAVNIASIVLGLPMLDHCYSVAVVVMILGSVLGLLQQVPEFVRNFIKIKPEHVIYVNCIWGLTIILRVVWLITATVVLVNSNCDNINIAWICIYINWGVLGLVVLAVSVVMIVKFLKERRQAKRNVDSVLYH